MQLAIERTSGLPKKQKKKEKEGTGGIFVDSFCSFTDRASSVMASMVVGLREGVLCWSERGGVGGGGGRGGRSFGFGFGFGFGCGFGLVWFRFRFRSLLLLLLFPPSLPSSPLFSSFPFPPSLSSPPLSSSLLSLFSSSPAFGSRLSLSDPAIRTNCDLNLPLELPLLARSAELLPITEKGKSERRA